MPTEPEFARAVTRIRESIEKIGDAVAEPIVDEEDPSRTIGYVVNRNGYTYQVVGDPGAEFFHLVFPFSIVNQLADLISEDDAREILEIVEGAGPGGSDLPRWAAEAVLNDTSEEERESFTYHLVIILSAEGAAYSLQNTDSGMVTGFEVFTKVFPYEPGFSLTEFNRSVQSVVNTGISGLIFVNLAFDFPAMIDTEGVSPAPPWYIH